MLTEAVLEIAGRSRTARRAIYRGFFEGLAGFTQRAEWWTLMNYGYVDLNGATPPVLLDPGDEAQRYCIQLYHHVASGVDLTGKRVVEVSSGRGGGASYVARHLGPRSVTGIDVAGAAVAFCRRVHKFPGLHFRQGDAEALPLPDASADVVINIEASFCYAGMDRFLSEVRRVLRPGGHFLYADLRMTEEVDDLLDALERSGLDIQKAEDITANVARALRLDHDRRIKATREHVPLALRGVIKTFVGAQGSRIPDFLHGNRMRYLNFVLQKPAVRGLPPREAVSRAQEMTEHSFITARAALRQGA